MIKQTIIVLYELFYKEFTGHKKFRLDFNRNKNEAKIDNFIGCALGNYLGLKIKNRKEND